jgi:hypothetical protein
MAKKAKKCSTGKVKYPSRMSAQRAMYDKASRNGIVGRTYRCSECRGWHTTRGSWPLPPVVRETGV